MWKLYFEYKDGGKITVTGKGTITPELQAKYERRYGIADKAILQQYPKKDHMPVILWNSIQN